jgi:arylesterase/paraoxonase
MKKISILILIVLGLYIFNIFWSTGYFRIIENKFEGEVLTKINIVGAEDITINHIDSFAIVSSTKRKAFPANQQEEGGLYYIDLKKIESKPILLTKDFNKPFAPHGISIFKTDSITTIAVVNHTIEKEYIEIFKLIGTKLTHFKTLDNPMILSPNDVVLINENSFYFTNDHKYKSGILRLAEDYLGLAISNVIFFDGLKFKEVANGISFANGINYNSKKDLLFVASPRKFYIKVFKKNNDNSLSFIENIYCGTGVDNIEFDLDNTLWIGAHPNLLHFDSYSKGNKAFAPSEIISIKYIEKNNYIKEKIYLEKGQAMSGSTVAAPFGNLILMGNVMDDHFLVLKK